MKKMKVDAIKDGTVIDHIPGGKATQVLLILNGTGNDPVSLGMNLASSKYGEKDIVKIENHELSAEEVNRIAIIAPTATITIIRDYEIQEKWKVSIPEELDDLVHCPNPACVTNMEKMKTRFEGTGWEPGQYLCHYCEKIYSAEELKMKAGYR